jgi:hypothetical protein
LGLFFQSYCYCIDAGHSGRGGGAERLNGAAEFAPALVVAPPQGYSVAVAVGSELRIFDIK